MIRVYLSSTFHDLEDCRAAVRKALRQHSVEGVSMEDYIAEDARPLDKCLADVARCDLYVGVFAWRYGYIPPGQTKSITELEYREARRLGITSLIFLLREDAPWPRSRMDLGPAADNIERLRDELTEEHLCGFFSAPEDLAGQVAAAVARLDRRSGHRTVSSRGSLTEERLNRYYDRLVRQYSGLELDSLTPPRADEYLQIGLMSVFVEPHVRADPPPAELPREWLERLRDQGELDPADLPELVDPGELEALRQSYRAKPRRPLFEAVTHPDCPAVVVLGDPGSGKSTFARYLVLTLAGARGGKPLPALADHLPILIELRAYVALAAEGRSTGFLDYLDHRARADGLGLERAALEHYLSFGGRALVVFDGLDEIFDQRHRAETAAQIVDFQARHSSVRVVVTSRIIGYPRRILTEAGFAHFTLQDLDEDEINEFLGRWYPRAVPDRSVDAEATRIRLLEAMRRATALRELAGNPLLLTILAIIGKHQLLPRDRRTLYDHATGVLVEHWDVNRHLSRADQPAFIDAEDKKALLRELAYHMQTSGRALSANYIEQEDLSRVFENYLRDRYRMSSKEGRSVALAMIGQLRERNFILSRYGLHLYGFVHRTFLEYFCAEAIVGKFKHDQQWRLSEVRQQFREHWADPTWHEVLRLVAGSLHERHAASLVALLTSEVNTRWPPGEFTDLPRNLALAVQCLAEARKLHSDLAAPAEALLKKLILLLEHSVGRNDPDLATLFAEEIVPAARSIGANWPGRRAYLRWYRRRGVLLVWSPTMTFGAQLAAILATPADHLEELFDGRLARIADNRASYAAVVGLAELAGAGAAESPVRSMLVRRIVEDGHAAVRLAAVQALGERFGADEDLIKVLVERARKDGSAGVRQAAVRALGERHRFTEAVRDLVVERAVRDPVAPVRRDAARVLIKRAPADEDLFETLLGLLRTGQDAELVTLAAEALLDRFPSGDEVRALLIARAGRARTGPVRRAAIRLLGERWITDPTVVELLLASIATEPDAGSLIEAARCFQSQLLAAERERAWSGLAARAAADPDETIRLAAVQVLADHLPDDAENRVAVLGRAQADHDGTVRLAAVTALARWAADDGGIRAALTERAGADADRAVRGASLAGLVAAGGEGSEIRALLFDLARHDPEPQLREQAVRMLADRHRGQAAVQRFIADRCRQDESRDVRLAACALLAGMNDGSGAAERTFMDRVRNDASGRVFACAAAAVGDWLGSSDGGRAVLMRRAGADANAHVRRAATELLGRLHGEDPRARAVLLRLVREDLDATVMAAAASAVARSSAAAEQAGTLAARAAADDPAVRAAALGVLGASYPAEPSTLPLLLAAAGKDDSVLVRRAALDILVSGFADRRPVREALVAALRDPHWSLREASVRLLGQHYGHEERTWRLLARLAADRADDPQLSLLAGQTLSWLPGAEPERMPALDLGV